MGAYPTVAAESDSSFPRASGAPRTGHRELWGVPLRRVGALSIPIGLLLLPFADHQSRDPVCLTYSWDYLGVLAGLAVGGLALAFALAWMVRRAPAHRQLTFALIILAVPVAATLALELYLGFREHDTFAMYRRLGQVKSPFMGFEAAPNHRWEHRGAGFSTDANGFRTHVGSRVAPEDETLVVVLGGSTAFGFGLEDDATWAHRLEHHLRARFGDDITVLNASNGGHNSLQQLFRFYLKVVPLNPDYVVYYGLINDIRRADQLAQRIWLPEGILETNSIREHLRRKNRGKGFYFENSVLLNHLQAVVERLLVPGREPDDPLLGMAAEEANVRRELSRPDSVAAVYGPAAETYLRNLESLRLLCAAADIELILTTELVNRAELPPTWSFGFDYLTEALRKHCCERGIALVDLFGQMETAADVPMLFVEGDKCHPSAAGAAFIAERLGGALGDRIAAARHAAPDARAQDPVRTAPGRTSPGPSAESGPRSE